MPKINAIPKFVRKRDGRLEPFSEEKIARAVEKAILAVSRPDGKVARSVANQVVTTVAEAYGRKIPTVEDVSDAVENSLMERGLADAAKAFILYRAERTKTRRIKEFFGVRDDLKLGVNAIKVLAERYLKKDGEGRTIETPSQLFRRVARAVAQSEQRYGGARDTVDESEETFYRMMANGEFLPNSPTLMNAGLPSGQLAACFVIPIEDSLDSIFDGLKAAAKIHQSGGGTGFSFSAIRPGGDIVRSTGGIASGPVSFIRLFDTTTDVIKQGGRRRGANMAILAVTHPSIREFVTAKADGKAFSNFNFSVGASDAFMRAVSRRGKISLVNPRSGKVSERVGARDIFDQIVTEAWRTGDPGVVWFDEIDRKNPTAHLGRIEATNPCGEQPLHAWESCTLGSINLSKIFDVHGRFDWAKLDYLVKTAVRFLDNVLDANNYPLPEIERATLANRRIGLGVMGFAETLIKLGIPYDSRRALLFGAKLIKRIRDVSSRASAELGRSRGSFPNFKGSLWAHRGYRAFRNATTTTIAPTGTISIIAGCSSGIEPLFAVAFVRNVMEGTRLLEVNPLFEEFAKKRGFYSSDLLFEIAAKGNLAGIKGIPADARRLFRTALEISPENHLRMQAVFQKYTDNAVSKTINLPAKATVADVRAAYLLAWKLKCKGITVYRYGSKPDQVLTLGTLDIIGQERHVTAESEFAGDCRGGVCNY
ncbi:adenosylcobalamin-dependent ribonucleoside-diphosphate reductase [Patescibacteria group bacterium]|nr:MAG: adenosylcobalamin-dependent ribonucleoside-diphosphate reductase [Patescibacteria group bacterium]